MVVPAGGIEDDNGRQLRRPNVSLVCLRANNRQWRRSRLPMRIAGAEILDAVWISVRSAFLVGGPRPHVADGCGPFGSLLVGLLSQCLAEDQSDKEQSDDVSHMLLLS